MHKAKRWKVVGVITLVIFAAPSYAQSGRISYYESGTQTASGERFNKNALTCAHKRLPFGTLVSVSYHSRSVICRVNDRGPFVAGRVLDVSLGAARALGMIGAGVVMADIKWYNR